MGDVFSLHIRLLNRFRARAVRDLRTLEAQERLGHAPRPLPLAAAIFVLVALLGLTTFALGRSAGLDVLLLIAAIGVFGIAVAVGGALAVAEYRAAQQADRSVAEMLALKAELDAARQETEARLHDARSLTAAMGAALHALARSGADPIITAALSEEAALLRQILAGDTVSGLEPIIVSEVLLQVSSFATLHGVTLLHEVADDAVILGNRDYIVAILHNLIDNSRKYAPGSPILIACEPAGPYLKLVVQDDGPGIASDDAARFFLPGVRRGHDAQGYGMGLAIARRFAQAMNGGLWYEPRSGRGSRFVLKLPRAADRSHGASEETR